MSVYEFINSTRLRAFANGSLEISDLTQGDEGVYACTATNSVGRDTVYIVLINLELYRFCELCSIWSGLCSIEIVEQLLYDFVTFLLLVICMRNATSCIGVNGKRS